MDNLHEVLLEGLSADMDSLCTYILSKHCDETVSSTSTQSPSSAATPVMEKGNQPLSKSYRNKTTSLSTSRLFYVRSEEEYAINRSTNRGRSYSVNDGHMSNIIIPGVDLEDIYRKVIRRQVELEVYFPSRDAVLTMMSGQFRSADTILER